MKLKGWIIFCICTGILFLAGLIMLIVGCCMNFLVALSSIAVLSLSGALGVLTLIWYCHSDLKAILALGKYDVDVGEKILWKAEAQKMCDDLASQLTDLTDLVHNLTVLGGDDSTPATSCDCKEELEKLEGMLQDMLSKFTGTGETGEVMQQFQECKDHLEYIKSVLDTLKKAILGDDYDADEA